jgi:molecular chaperone DnaK
MIANMLRRLSGKEPDASVSVDEAVAHGAALHANILMLEGRGQRPVLDIKNVNSHSLGVVATDPRTQRRRNAILIPRNTPLPVTAKRVFRTQKDGQKTILVQIVEGESASPDDCSQIGRCVARDLPAELPAQTPIEVRFSYQENGRLTVNVLVAGSRHELRHEITRDNTMNQQQLDAWRLFVTGHQGEGSQITPGSSAVTQVLPGEITIVGGDSMIGPSESSILRGEPPVAKSGQSSIITGDDVGTDDDLQIVDE